ncbi:MAG: hypothetical protein INR62_11115 [Rhodospirillales bacterium]|nr:hypothetical protein [Acetobacter sp.]
MDRNNDKPSVLVVEDNIIVRDVLIMMIEDDFTPIPTGTVTEALDILADPSVPTAKVVLVDCLLPDGGPRLILEEASRRKLPCVLISGDAGQAAAFGPQYRFLMKPFSRAMLYSALTDALA